MGPILRHVLVFLIYCSLFSSSLPKTIEEGRTYFVDVSTLMPVQACSCKDAVKGIGIGIGGASNERRGTLEVRHRLHPCSQKQVDNETLQASTFSQMLMRDRKRVTNMNNLMFDPDAMTGLPIEYGDTFNISGDYLTKIGLGSQNQKVSVVLDTGSTLTWTQCSPCPKGGCYAQKEPIFDTRKSKSYSSIRCDAPLCKQLNDSWTVDMTTCSKNGICLYINAYGDDSYTQGKISSDVLTLTKNDMFPSFNFGCSQGFNGSFGSTAGILGLGRGKNMSFVTQTIQKYKGLFSYCLPSTNCLSGHLTFGNATSGHASCGPRSAITNIFTPLIRKLNHPPYYFVNMTGISVASQKLKIEPTILSKGGGTIIDSGTTFTSLAPKAYAALKSQVIKEMATYKYPKLDENDEDLLCYNLTNYRKVHIPKISLFFESYENEKEEVEVPIHPTGIFTSATDASELVCLAFSQDSQLGTFGNFQQKTYTVTYDTIGKKLGFHPNGCE